MSYEEACRISSIVPKFRRAVKDGLVFGGGKELDLTGVGLGDDQFAALLCDSSLVPVRNIRRWRLPDTRLSDAGVAALGQTMSEQVEVLDLARNWLTARGVQSLLSARQLNATQSLMQLRRLDLSSNNLRNNAAEALARGAPQIPALLCLELNHNVIQDGDVLGGLIAAHVQLMLVSLHCNFLCGAGAASLFRGVLRNCRAGGQLASLDVSWNGIGDAGCMDAATALANVLEESVTLFHLDLSYNNLNAAACAKMGQGLRDNHFLYGLHLVGNAAIVDADGFLSPQREDDLVESPKAQGRKDSVLFGDQRKGLGLRVAGAKRPSPDDRPKLHRKRASNQEWSISDALRERDILEEQTTCWACEGWERVELVWPISIYEDEPTAVWAFTSLDGYSRGLPLRRMEDPPRFVVARMIPPNYRLRVIFQVDAALRLPPGCRPVRLEQPAEIRLRTNKELPALHPPAGQDVVIQTPEEVVLRLGQACLATVQGHTGRPALSAPAPALCGRRVVLLDDPDNTGGPPVEMPRITETEHRQKKKRGKLFFENFRRDRGDLLEKCFRVDWGRSKVSRIVHEDEREEVQQLMLGRFHHVMALYRDSCTASLIEPGGGFGISQFEAERITTHAGLAGDKVTTLSDNDRLFIAAMVIPAEMKKMFIVRNNKALVRFQFLEFLLRLADQRFMQTGACRSMVEAVGRVLDALEPVANAHLAEQQAFFSAFHTEAIHTMCERHEGILRTAYERWSGRNTKPGHTHYMSLAEFEELLHETGVHDEYFPQRSAAKAYRFGMMTQVEECFDSRFQEMSYLELLHGLGAVVFMRAMAGGGAHPTLAARPDEKASPAAAGPPTAAKAGGMPSAEAHEDADASVGAVATAAASADTAADGSLHMDASPAADAESPADAADVSVRAGKSADGVAVDAQTLPRLFQEFCIVGLQKALPEQKKQGGATSSSKRPASKGVTEVVSKHPGGERSRRTPAAH